MLPGSALHSRQEGQGEQWRIFFFFFLSGEGRKSYVSSAREALLSIILFIIGQNYVLWPPLY